MMRDTNNFEEHTLNTPPENNSQDKSKFKQITKLELPPTVIKILSISLVAIFIFLIWADRTNSGDSEIKVSQSDISTSSTYAEEAINADLSNVFQRKSTNNPNVFQKIDRNDSSNNIVDPETATTINNSDEKASQDKNSDVPKEDSNTQTNNKKTSPTPEPVANNPVKVQKPNTPPERPLDHQVISKTSTKEGVTVNEAFATVTKNSLTMEFTLNKCRNNLDRVHAHVILTEDGQSVGFSKLCTSEKMNILVNDNLKPNTEYKAKIVYDSVEIYSFKFKTKK